MRFSQNANNYINKLSRDADFVISDKQLIIDYLKSNNIHPFEKIVAFQMDFSGLALTITNKPNSAFNAFLFSEKDIQQNNLIDSIKIEDKFYFYCGEHETAPFWFVISESGEICTYDHIDGTVNIIASSFEKFIDDHAFRDLLAQHNTYEHPNYYNLKDNNGFQKITNDYFYHEVQSDDYNSWFSKDNLIICKGTCYDSAEFSIHIYGDNQELCNHFIEILKAENII